MQVKSRRVLTPSEVSTLLPNWLMLSLEVLFAIQHVDLDLTYESWKSYPRKGFKNYELYGQEAIGGHGL